MQLPIQFAIGTPNWADTIRRFTDGFKSDYWSDFCALSPADATGIEKSLNRPLPSDFRQFLVEFGCGNFLWEFGGGIYTPDEMLAACPGPLFMQLGSADWASDEAHRDYYISRGKLNPDPSRFNDDAINQNGFSLLDLLQIGTDGSCGYHQLFVGESDPPFRYCRLAEDEVLDKLPSFSDALRDILNRHSQYRDED